MINEGIIGRADTIVNENNTAAAAGSGDLMVFSTPSMIALMEKASHDSIAPYLEDGQGSVGTHLDVKHLAATPIGKNVYAVSEVTFTDGKKVSFNVSAYDETGLIGEGTHQRAIITKDRFMKKCAER